MCSSYKSILSKDNSNILRGLAILSIMFHNFLHVNYGFSVENEMDFSQKRADAFFNAISSQPTMFFGELSSFLGWIGVPVFVFLTGYGLQKKYHHRQPVDTFAYIKHNYLKLLFLLLPAIIYFMCFDIKNHLGVEVLKKIFSLTMLHNLDYPHLYYDPRVYWYFSLTFQFYIVFLLFRKYFTPSMLLLVSIVSIVLLGFLGQSEFTNTMSIYKHCVTGWFPVFAIGIWLANKSEKWFASTNMGTDIVLLVLFFCFTLLMNKNYYTWLLLPLVALFMFFYLAKIILRIPALAKIFIWIGRYSAFIFVCHPIARHLYNSLESRINLHNIYFALFFYALLTFVLSYLYKRFYYSLPVIQKLIR